LLGVPFVRLRLLSIAILPVLGGILALGAIELLALTR